MNERQVAVLTGVVGCGALMLFSPVLFTVATYLYFAMAGMIAQSGLLASRDEADRYSLACLICLSPATTGVAVLFVQFWRNKRL